MAAEARGARPDWLAAAQTVTTGAGDRATASELIDQEVKPFVDNDIRAQWLTAMRSAIAAVADAYDAASGRAHLRGGRRFDVPGELGPSWSAPPATVLRPPPPGPRLRGLHLRGLHRSARRGRCRLRHSRRRRHSRRCTTAPNCTAAAAAAASAGRTCRDGRRRRRPSAVECPTSEAGSPGSDRQLGDMLGGLIGTSRTRCLNCPRATRSTRTNSTRTRTIRRDRRRRRGRRRRRRRGCRMRTTKPEVDETGETEADPATDAVGEPARQSGSGRAATSRGRLPPAPTEPVPIPPPEPHATAGRRVRSRPNELPQVGE